jgi:hypothetical protein
MKGEACAFSRSTGCFHVSVMRLDELLREGQTTVGASMLLKQASVRENLADIRSRITELKLAPTLTNSSQPSV